MAGGVNVFNVEFGINDTALTRCLENRDFEEALQLVENAFGVALDYGRYQRTPLFIVLSGEKSEFDGRSMPVHLALARKLIERGADPNLRIPQTCGAEYIGPGRSPLQCIVDFFNFLTRRDQYHSMRCQTIPASRAVSLSGRTHVSASELVEDLIDMMWLLLGHGAKANVLDVEHKTPLHNTLLRSGDIRMAQALTDNNADINAVDCYGNTPLMSVCCPLPWREYGDYGPSVKKHDITEVVQHLVKFDNIKLDHVSPHNRSALFYAMQAGNMSVARILLQHGANPSIRGLGPDGRYISPLLAALVPWPFVGRDPKSIRTILLELSILIDNGFFNTEEILKEILEYAVVERSGDEALTRLKKLDNALINLVFGSFSCSLAQLAARAFISATLPAEIFESLSTADLVAIVRQLALPRICVTHFQIILLREKILSSLAETDWDEWSMEEFSDDSQDESDGEYW